MNTIKIYLAESGRVADLKKDFPLYQGQFQNNLLNIYVPTSLLAPEFKTLSQEQTTSEYVAGTAVKIGMTYLARNGEIKVGKNYYMRYLKTLTYQNVEYALFERKLPREFTLYAGQGTNAPVLIANVVNIDTENNEILSIITSQTCSIDVMASSSLDNDEAVEPTELETINARLNSIDQVLPTKQDKADESLNTANKTVVGGINELKESTDTNTANVAQNTENIAKNKQDIADIKQLVGTGEDYIGTLNWTSETLPTNEQLNDYVNSIVARATKNGDVVIVVQKLEGKTDKNYKYIYTNNDWQNYEIPPMELASNGTAGLVAGTYGVGSTNDTLVDISGGQILNIYVKDNAGTFRNIREYINANATNLANIINGNTSVGIALKAIADGLGNNIVNTYLTQTAGATKDFVRKYALPREFNDIFYISKSGYSKEVATDVAPQFAVTTNNIGDFTLFDLTKTNDCEYELSRKNSADNSFFISASRDCIVTFRLTTQAKNVGQDWTDLDVELSTPISMTAGQLQRIDFASIFSYLGEKVLDLKVGDMLRQTLEVITQDITQTTFNIYSNETYPSIFNINTLSQVVYHTLGKLGEQPVFELAPNGAITESGLSLIGSEIAQLYNNVECQVVINIPITTQGYELFSEDLSILSAELGGLNIRFATPYNFESGNPTFKNLTQVAHTKDAVNGITYTMKCFIKITDGGDITFIVDEDDISETASVLDDNTFIGKQTFNGELEVNAGISVNSELKVTDNAIKSIDTASDTVATYQGDKIKIEQGGTASKTLTLPKADGTLLLDTDEKVMKTDTDQTVDGIKTFSNYIKTPQVASVEGKGLVRYKETEGKSVYGNDSTGNVLMGNTDRPSYSKSGSDFNGSELALLSDLNDKLEASNIKAGTNITVSTSGNDVTISAVAEGASVVNIGGERAPIVNFDSDPQTQITNNDTDISNLQSTKLDSSKADKNVVNGVTISANDDNVNVVRAYVNLSTQATSSDAETFPLANDTTAGLMSKADYSQIRDNKARIEQLEGQNVRLTYTASTSPTASQIETFVKAEGYTDTSKWIYIGVVVSGTNHIWRYYTNTTTWTDIGVDTVNQFTNSIAGIIKGSATAGKVYAETDGTGSVYGWDNLNTSVSNNTSAISTETSARENADNNLQTQINSKQDSLTTAQQNAVNSGITSSLVTQISTNKTNIATNTTNISTKANLTASNLSADNVVSWNSKLYYDWVNLGDIITTLSYDYITMDLSTIIPNYVNGAVYEVTCVAGIESSNQAYGIILGYSDIETIPSSTFTGSSFCYHNQYGASRFKILAKRYIYAKKRIKVTESGFLRILGYRRIK